MPIRFRCAYCNQLMGIAKRKAGQVVTCPKCAGQVVVPTPDPAMEEEERNSGNAAAAFEEDDEVQKLLEFVEETKPAPLAGPAGGRKMPAPAGQQVLPMPHVATQRPLPQPVVGTTYPADVDVVPMTAGAPLVPARGVFLTPGVLSILLILVGLLMGLAFFLGFLLGRSTVG
jgi:phage FluMu protein Com